MREKINEQISLWLEAATNQRMHATTKQINGDVIWGRGKDRRGCATVGERRGGLRLIVLGRLSWEKGENIIK